MQRQRLGLKPLPEEMGGIGPNPPPQPPPEGPFPEPPPLPAEAFLSPAFDHMRRPDAAAAKAAVAAGAAAAAAAATGTATGTATGSATGSVTGSAPPANPSAQPSAQPWNPSAAPSGPGRPGPSRGRAAAFCEQFAELFAIEAEERAGVVAEQTAACQPKAVPEPERSAARSRLGGNHVGMLASSGLANANSRGPQTAYVPPIDRQGQGQGQAASEPVLKPQEEPDTCQEEEPPPTPMEEDAEEEEEEEEEGLDFTHPPKPIEPDFLDEILDAI